MNKLYCGLRSAVDPSAEQIELAHKTAMDKLQQEDPDHEQAIAR